MIHLYVNPTGIERVVIESTSTIEEDFDHAAWCAIRRMVGQIDSVLARTAAVAASAGIGRPGTPEAAASATLEPGVSEG